MTSMHWREMTAEDVARVEAMADVIHEDHPEDPAVFAERQRLHPGGCLLLELDGKPAGYALTHPWIYGQPPALDVMLEAIPADADCYHIHDVALLATARGSGAASAGVKAIIDHARSLGFERMTLVAVNDTVPFWSRFGFTIDENPALAAKLATYAGHARHMSLAL